MTKLTDTFNLTNRTTIPKVGFGTWQIPASQTKQAVLDALSVGYRHIDTALVYGNEKQVGEAVKESGMKRDDVFVTTKLPAETKSYQGTLNDFNTSLSNLDLEYVDLYLVHAPQPWSQTGGNYDLENRDVWKAMEEIYKSGRAKAIGVSNFDANDLSNILNHSEIKPMVDQIQYYVGYTEDAITKYAQSHNILVEAYSPLATGALLNNKGLKTMAKKYDVDLPQLAIQFCIQNGIVPLPKATRKTHIESNTKLNFEISDADMDAMRKMKDTSVTWHFR